MSELSLTLPKILDLPEKLLPLITKFNDYRYFLIKGGRGGGKSQGIGRLILYIGEKRKARIVCGREVQKNIDESVYSILHDLIRSFDLNTYKVFKTKIEHPVSGTNINFRGFREQGVFNIQGMEGVDIVWIDEAQAITKPTMDVLIPTIRKDTAKIIFTMNPHTRDDAVVKFCEGRADCLIIDINYDENKHCTDALIHEAEECKKKDLDDYEHIWMGRPLDMTEDSVFTYSEIEQAKSSSYALREGYGYRIGAFDIARYGDDKCACVILQQMGALHWEEVFVDEWGHKDLNYTTGRILTTINDMRIDKAIIDEDGLGSGPLDTLRHGRGMEKVQGFRNPTIAYKDNKNYVNYRTANAYKAKKMINDGHLHLKDEGTCNELLTLKYKYDHQQRKVLISKQEMKLKFQIKSPNKADALIMAVSLVGEIRMDQEEQYYPRHPQTYSEGNLFETAGVL